MTATVKLAPWNPQLVVEATSPIVLAEVVCDKRPAELAPKDFVMIASNRQPTRLNQVHQLSWNLNHTLAFGSLRNAVDAEIPTLVDPYRR